MKRHKTAVLNICIKYSPSDTPCPQSAPPDTNKQYLCYCKWGQGRVFFRERSRVQTSSQGIPFRVRVVVHAATSAVYDNSTSTKNTLLETMTPVLKEGGGLPPHLQDELKFLRVTFKALNSVGPKYLIIFPCLKVHLKVALLAAPP